MPKMGVVAQRGPYGVGDLLPSQKFGSFPSFLVILVYAVYTCL